MPATLQALDNFHRFAADQLRNPDPAASLKELPGRWRRASVLRPIGRPLDDFMAEHNIPGDA